ncbi:hypothetical protein ABK040_005453 [Willaertia magna]
MITDNFSSQLTLSSLDNNNERKSSTNILDIASYLSYVSIWNTIEQPIVNPILSFCTLTEISNFYQVNKQWQNFIKNYFKNYQIENIANCIYLFYLKLKNLRIKNKEIKQLINLLKKNKLLKNNDININSDNNPIITIIEEEDESLQNNKISNEELYNLLIDTFCKQFLIPLNSIITMLSKTVNQKTKLKDLQFHLNVELFLGKNNNEITNYITTQKYKSYSTQFIISIYAHYATNYLNVINNHPKKTENLQEDHSKSFLRKKKSLASIREKSSSTTTATSTSTSPRKSPVLKGQSFFIPSNSRDDLGNGHPHSKLLSPVDNLVSVDTVNNTENNKTTTPITTSPISNDSGNSSKRKMTTSPSTPSLRKSFSLKNILSHRNQSHSVIEGKKDLQKQPLNLQLNVNTSNITPTNNNNSLVRKASVSPSGFSNNTVTNHHKALNNNGLVTTPRRVIKDKAEFLLSSPRRNWNRDSVGISIIDNNDGNNTLSLINQLANQEEKSQQRDSIVEEYNLQTSISQDGNHSTMNWMESSFKLMEISPKATTLLGHLFLIQFFQIIAQDAKKIHFKLTEGEKSRLEFYACMSINNQLPKVISHSNSELELTEEDLNVKFKEICYWMASSRVVTNLVISGREWTVEEMAILLNEFDQIGVSTVEYFNTITSGNNIFSNEYKVNLIIPLGIELTQQSVIVNHATPYGALSTLATPRVGHKQANLSNSGTLISTSNITSELMNLTHDTDTKLTKRKNSIAEPHKKNHSASMSGSKENLDISPNALLDLYSRMEEFSAKKNKRESMTFKALDLMKENKSLVVNSPSNKMKRRSVFEYLVDDVMTSEENTAPLVNTPSTKANRRASKVYSRRLSSKFTKAISSTLTYGHLPKWKWPTTMKKVYLTEINENFPFNNSWSIFGSDLSIEELHFNFASLPPISFDPILSCKNHLKSLHIMDCYLNDRTVPANFVNVLQQLTLLEHLSLEKVQLDKSGGWKILFQDFLENCKTLKTVKFSECKIQLIDVEILVKSLKNRKVELQKVELNFKGMVYISKEKERLDLNLLVEDLILNGKSKTIVADLDFQEGDLNSTLLQAEKKDHKGDKKKKKCLIQ